MSPNQREGITALSTISGKNEYLTSTSGVLNVNASVSISGSPIPVTGATTAIVTAIVDGSGNQITSFGGGTQYTDGAAPPTHPTGPTLEFNNAGAWATVGSATPLPVTATFSPSGTQDVNLKQVNGNTVVTAANGVQANAISNGTNIANVTAAHALLVDTSLTALPSAIVAFVTAVSTAGTRVNLASNALTQGIILEAPSTNTGKIYVGGSTVSSTVYGAELSPGQATSFAGNNTNLIYIDASVNGDKCSALGS